MTTNPKKLLVQLNNTGLQNKDAPLYQLLKSLIENLSTVDKTAVAASSSGSTTSITEQNTFIIPTEDILEGEFFPPQVGPQGNPGPTGSQGPIGLPYISEDGLDGDPFPPIQGPQGNPGPTGAQGPMGVSVVHEDVIYPDDLIIASASNTNTVAQNIVQTIETTTYTITGAFADITNLTVNITPRFLASKIRVICSITLYAGTNNFVAFQILRGASVIKTYQGLGTNAGPTQMTVVLDYIDSPASTSALTYKIQTKNEAGAGAINNVVIGGEVNVSSSITAQEIFQ